ncbi:hypothetical protein [Streptomyces salinarius]|uniref:hypothetical protein n=1 Tax=Streptomyces salinarius TaxID=2762598 RepID=UPI001646E10A|nr:hypothetical protein [Streptomyces salinarius]
MGSAVVLGIESSCDETGAGLVRDGRLLGHAVASSMDEHARFGGRPVSRCGCHRCGCAPTTAR